MKKRFLSVVLLLAITCALCLNANASVSDGADLVSSNAAQASNISDPASSESYIFGDSFAYTYAVPESIQALDHAPDEISTGDTKDFLEWFLTCDSIRMAVSGRLLSSPRVGPIDLSVYPAYRELITRTDLMPSIIAFLSENGDNIDEFRGALSALLQQPEIQALMNDATGNTANLFNNLNLLQSTTTNIAETSQYAFTINDIAYYYNGKNITSANNKSAKSYAAERNLNSNEIAAFNSIANSCGAITVLTPSSKYNCHSFAWYKSSYMNTTWMDTEGLLAFMSDSGCSRIAESQLQEKDIVVYVRRISNDSYYPLHSGYIYTNEDSQITVCSKWGQGCVALHEISNVPLDYRDTASSVICFFYRYHDFEYSYTGNNYHFDNKHYYEYKDKCSLCSLTQGDSNWTSLPCTGPTCITPWSLPGDHVAA